MRRQAEGLRHEGHPVPVSESFELEDDSDETAVVGHKTVLQFGGGGLPLDQFPAVMAALRAAGPAPVPHTPKVGRNAPCPCGSGQKFKKCCGTGRLGGGD